MSASGHITCEIARVRRIGRDVYRTTLVPEQTPLPEFKAGQYLLMQLLDGSWRPFSIASPPCVRDSLELHVRRLPGHDEADRIVSQLKHQSLVNLELPFGRCLLPGNSRPVVFIAGGTGFAPFKSVIEQALYEGDPRPMHLYWGAQSPDDLYLAELPQTWASDRTQLQYTPVISGDGNDWHGRRGLVHEAVMQDYPDLSGHEVFIGGSELMVMAVFADLRRQGVAEDQIHSDILHIKRDLGEL